MKYIFKLLLERVIDEKCDDFPDPMPPMIWRTFSQPLLERVLRLASGLVLPMVSAHRLFLCEGELKMSERVIEIDWASIHTSMSMKFSFHIFDHSIRKLVLKL